MAKMKTFAVEVEITQKVTVYVEARRPGGALEKLKTEDGWKDAVRWQCDEDDSHLMFAFRDITKLGEPRAL